MTTATNATKATSAAADREQVRRAAHVLDNLFRVPGTRRRFGVDALIGLVPGVGDAAGLALSSAVILQAIRLGARGATVGRMVLYAGLDALIGTIPIVGSVFDFAFKANSRNIALLERHTTDPAATAATSAKVLRRTVIGALVALVLIGLAVLALLVWVVDLLL
jgi:uncharacterized membrane protein